MVSKKSVKIAYDAVSNSGRVPGLLYQLLTGHVLILGSAIKTRKFIWGCLDYPSYGLPP